MITLKNVVLGSKSPRRKELLKTIIPNFEIITKNVDEIIPSDIKPIDAARYLAQLKAQAYNDEINKGKTIITADTIVLHNQQILGKPYDPKDAFQMIESLSGDSHRVITGVCIKNNEREIVFDSVTKVYFKNLSEAEINHYIQHYKPFDKAGAYGIQEWIGMIGVEKIEGCYFNVVGLPTSKLYHFLASL